MGPLTIADSDFFIDLSRPKAKHHPQAVEAVERMEDSGLQIHMTALTRFELMSGAERFHDPEGEKAKLQRLAAHYPTLALTPAAADRAGQIHGTLAREGRPIGVVDSFIAGIALQAGEALLTRNVREFSRVQGLRLEPY